MEYETQEDVLEAIYQEVEKLLAREDLPSGVEEKLNLILALSRYRFDIRTDDEIKDGVCEDIEP